jgi:4-amino-4-deoxy-L-arabinose transferase-like glycosyltransferase
LLGIFMLFLAGWTLFWQLGEGSLNDWDEATYAQVAHEMAVSGDWATPRWNGVPFRDKPPFVMWLMATSMMITHSTGLAARIPSALAGLFTVGMTVWLGRSLFGIWTGLTAATLLLASSKGWSVNFVLLSRQAMLDVPLTGFMVWALLHFWIGIRRPQHWLFMAIPLGLGVLTKSFLVLPIVLVCLVFVSLLALAGQPFSRQHWRYAAGAVTVVFAISLPWHVMQLLLYGHDFFHDYVLIHFMKILKVEGSHKGDWTFYFRMIRRAAPPYWLWIVIPALCLSIWAGIRFRDRRILLLVLWIAIPLLFFSLIPTKLPWYIVPIQPALALVIAFSLRAVVPQHWIPETFVLAALVLCVSLWNIRVLKPMDYTWDVKALGDCVVRITPAHEQIAYYDPNETYQIIELPLWNIRPSVLFYANRPMIAVHDPGQLNEWVKQGGRFVWTEASVADQISASFILIAQEGEQKYFRHADVSDWQDDGRRASASLPSLCHGTDRLAPSR